MLLGGTGLISSTQMFSIWRYVIVGATLAAAVLTPSTDPFTQGLLALPLLGARRPQPRSFLLGVSFRPRGVSFRPRGRASNLWVELQTCGLSFNPVG